LKIWDKESKEVTKEKGKAYRRWLNTKSIHNKVNHKRLPATEKRETEGEKSTFMGEIYITDGI
jgi:hypothetical protein